MGPELLTPKFLATAINADLLSFVWCFPHDWFLHLQYFSVLVNLEIWALVLDFILANCPIPPLHGAKLQGIAGMLMLLARSKALNILFSSKS